MDYFEKTEKKPSEDLGWNIPDRKLGIVNVIGGNTQNFRAEVKVSEFLSEKYPIETVNTILPDSLKEKLPPLSNFVFLKSTDAGSFANEEELEKMFNTADFNLLIGDLSKNSITGRAVAGACISSEKPLLITRDTVDLIAENSPEKVILNKNIIIFGSMAQLQKLFRTIYYPKMILLSQSLIQVADTLHKFTLSYPISVITLHNGQILVAKNGNVRAVPLEVTGYSPISFWQGELASKVVVFNLYNPDNFMNASVSAFFS